jgi:hypothetical protein
MPTGVYVHKRGYKTDKPRRIAVRVIGPSIAYLTLTRGLFAVIDAEDIERVGAWSWNATQSPHDTTTYARTSEGIGNGGTKSFTLHRFLMGFPECQIDHRNGNGLHNWKGNIRTSDASTNQFNSAKSKRNTSGFKGVCWHPQGWQARICIRGKRKHLGFFKTPEEAGRAYELSAKNLHGEFFRLQK